MIRKLGTVRIQNSICFLVCIGAFGFASLYDLYTLNFQPSESGGGGLPAPLYVLLIGIDYYLSLYPAFTISTNFPIIAITLRNNLADLVRPRYYLLYILCCFDRFYSPFDCRSVHSSEPR